MLSRSPSERKTFCGVSFDAPFASITNLSLETPNRFKFEPAIHSRIPTSAILPRFGERIRGDWTIPPHPRGVGSSWPPDSHVLKDQGSGRLPIDIAWSLAEQHNSWKWLFQGETHELSPYAAIAACIRDALPNYEDYSTGRGITLTIPNHWQEERQQALLDAINAEGVSARLLWRPVAATIAWQSHGSTSWHERIASNPTSPTPPKVLVLNLGVDGIELTVLELVPTVTEAKRTYIPGRRRPVADGLLKTTFGWRTILGNLTEQLRINANQDDFGKLWKTLWATDWLKKSRLTYRTEYSSASFNKELLKLIGVQANDDGELQAILDWGRKWRARLSKEWLIGTVTTGHLTGVFLSDGEVLANRLLRELGVDHVESFVDGHNYEPGLIAKGAALYALQSSRGTPTYFDTLPRLQAAVTYAGTPRWIDLLPDDQRFVDGGKVWKRPENLSGLSLAKGSHDLKLALAHEDFDRVREVVAELPKLVVEKEPVKISVAIEPAQGNARLEVHPDNTDVFGRRRIAFDWRKMKETDVTQEGYLQSIPLIFPGLLPRLSSIGKWNKTKWNMKDCAVKLLRNRNGASVFDLRTLTGLLREKDAKKFPRDSTAIGSDGEAPNDAEVLNKFVEAAFSQIGDSDECSEYLVRTIAYTSTAYRPYLDFLHQELSRLGVRSPQQIVTGCGWCLRDPSHVLTFASLFQRRLFVDPIDQIWWKAFSEILRYRDDATRDIPNELAESLTTFALEIVDMGVKLKRGQLLFRYACVAIVYLLRRRSYEDGYLNPEGSLAERIKSSFRKAQTAVREGKLQLVGGSVDLAAQLQLMIDFIDRRGSGQMLLGECTL